MPGKIIDLHAHTTISDGSVTPSELVIEAKKAGLSACAITDHDCALGAAEFMSGCKSEGIEGVPGIELSAEYSGQMHIVGLYIDYNNRIFNEKAERLRCSREIRNLEMIERCCHEGLYITKEELLNIDGVESLEGVGRPHFAKIFVDKGYVRDKNEAFEKYLKKGNPCYCPRKLYPPEECIEMIHNAGGIAILAHPVLIEKNFDKLYDIVKELKNKGLDGMECNYSINDDEFTKGSIELCEKLDLLKSGGSDFHGENKPGLMLGYGYGNLRVPYEYLEKIKEKVVI